MTGASQVTFLREVSVARAIKAGNSGADGDDGGLQLLNLAGEMTTLRVAAVCVSSNRVYKRRLALHH